MTDTPNCASGHCHRILFLADRRADVVALENELLADGLPVRIRCVGRGQAFSLSLLGDGLEADWDLLVIQAEGRAHQVPALCALARWHRPALPIILVGEALPGEVLADCF